MASEKEQIWLSEYLKCFNATEAARRAGYTWPNVQGQQKKEKFRDEIKRVLSQRAYSPEEIIDELQQIAQGDLGDMMEVTSMGFSIDMKTAKKNGLTKLIRKAKQKTTLYQSKSELVPDSETHEIEIELYSRHEALRDLAKVHALFVDRTRNDSDALTMLLAMKNEGKLTAADIPNLTRDFGENLVRQLFGATVEVSDAGDA